MKLRILIQTLALTALMAFLAPPALAGSIVSPATAGSTDLQAQVDASYTVVIPESMTGEQSLSGGVNTIGTIAITTLNLEPGARLYCTVEDGVLTRQGGTETLPYSAYFGADKTTKTIELKANTSTDVNVEVEPARLATARAGTYHATLNYILSTSR